MKATKDDHFKGLSLAGIGSGLILLSGISEALGSPTPTAYAQGFIIVMWGGCLLLKGLRNDIGALKGGQAGMAQIPLDVTERLIDMAAAHLAGQVGQGADPHTPSGKMWADDDNALCQATAIYVLARGEDGKKYTRKPQIDC